MSSLKISENALRIMIKDATDTFPNECCGFFFGLSGEEPLVTDVQLVFNKHEGDQKRRFKIDPTDYQAAEQYATANGLDILGVYHSHPLHPAVPSDTDLQSAVPFLSYIILSVHGTVVDAVTSWQLDLDTGEFYEESLRICEGTTAAA